MCIHIHTPCTTLVSGTTLSFNCFSFCCTVCASMAPHLIHVPLNTSISTALDAKVDGPKNKVTSIVTTDFEIRFGPNVMSSLYAPRPTKYLSCLSDTENEQPTHVFPHSDFATYTVVSRHSGKWRRDAHDVCVRVHLDNAETSAERKETTMKRMGMKGMHLPPVFRMTVCDSGPTFASGK
jgi:hypothetical protein